MSSVFKLDATSGENRDTYKRAGVDAGEAESALRRLTRHIRGTWPEAGVGKVMLPIGYFANVIDIGGKGIAMCTDGVGSKAVVAQMLSKYDTIGIDCVAMNVNDLICVGARPLSMVDYIAVEQENADMLEEISVGLAEGAKLAGISISGGEIAQLKDIVHGFDLVGMAVGDVPLDKIIDGSSIKDGDVVIGLESSGIHSNGLSLARHTFFEKHGFDVHHVFPELGVPLGIELLRPTFIYVREIMAVLSEIQSVKALINITGDGFLNLSRTAAKMGFIIDALPPTPPIFDLIEKYSDTDLPEMFQVYNMGVGFCLVVAKEDADGALEVLERNGRKAWTIGRCTDDTEKRVQLPEKGIVGREKRFSWM